MTAAQRVRSPELEKEAGRSFWDANPCGGEWETYSAFLDWYRRTEPYMFGVVDAHEWRGLRVLEIGCGQGALVNHLAAGGAVMTGLDMSPASLARTSSGARELHLHSRVSLLQADAELLPFTDGTFDRVVSFGVLHHTPDTAHAVDEIRRVLRPGGRAIVMLYRRGNPKWLATRVLRSLAAFLGRRRRTHLVDRSRRSLDVNDSKGTSLLELFGVPTLKAYSNRESRLLFGAFTDVTIRNCQPGFQRLADIRPGLRPIRGLLATIDRVMHSRWGFYQVIEAHRKANGSKV